MSSARSGDFLGGHTRTLDNGRSAAPVPPQTPPPHPRASDALLPAVYDELRAMAQSLLAAERPDHTLQATALVHEAWLKLADQSGSRWNDKAHFFAVAAQAMRRILVDHARAKNRQKRGGGQRPVLLSDFCKTVLPQHIELLTLDEALEALAADDPMDAQIVEMRFFAGLKVREIAAVLSVAEKTVQRRWNYAKARLHQLLAENDSKVNRHEPPAHTALA